jgi:hypothetical protein
MHPGRHIAFAGYVGRMRRAISIFRLGPSKIERPRVKRGPEHARTMCCEFRPIGPRGARRIDSGAGTKIPAGRWQLCVLQTNRTTAAFRQRYQRRCGKRSVSGRTNGSRLHRPACNPLRSLSPLPHCSRDVQQEPPRERDAVAKLCDERKTYVKKRPNAS